jgi:hypothetical protein
MSGDCPTQHTAPAKPGPEAGAPTAVTAQGSCRNRGHCVSKLSLAAIAKLSQSGIEPAQAVKLGLFDTPNAGTIYPRARPAPGIVIPYFDTAGELVSFEYDGKLLPFARIRYLDGCRGAWGEGSNKYYQPSKSPVHAYFSPIVAWAQVAADPRQPCFLVEGEFKAAKLCLEGYNAIGIGGCWNFRSDGGLRGLKQLLPELEQFIWKERPLYLCMDGDAATNPHVAAAERQLALEFGLRRSARVYRIRLPDGMKPDDFIVSRDAEAFEQLARQAELLHVSDAARAQIEELNARFAVVKSGSRVVVADLTGGPDFLRREDFNNLLANRKFPHPTKPGNEIALAKMWFESPDRREYPGGIDFAPPPRQPRDGALNLWTGFAVASALGDWSLWRAHVFENVCGSDQESFDYLMCWFASAVQRPGEPGQVALVLRGGRGVGKGVTFAPFLQIFGRHALHITQAEHVTGRFNGHLDRCAFALADEAFFSGDPRHEKILNGLITEESRLSERKFLDAVQVPNCLHLAISTNSEWAVPAAMDERRYFVLNVPDHPNKQESVYFGAIVRQMQTSGTAALLHDLLAADVRGFDVRRVPQTAALADQKQRTLHARGGPLAWLHDVLSAGEIRAVGEFANTIAWSEQGLLVSRNDLFSAYEAWDRRRGGRGQPVSRDSFGRLLSKALGDAVRGGDNVRLPTALNRDRPRAYQFAGLRECQRAFLRSQNMPTPSESEQ